MLRLRFPWPRSGTFEATPRPGGEATPLPAGELPVLAARAVLEWSGTRNRVVALRAKLGLPVEFFERDIRSVIEAFAEFVQLLPATECHHHAQPGGLLAQALETAGLALDARRGQILPRGAAPEVIGEQAPRWTYAVFLAALLHDIDPAIDGLRVTLRNGTGDSGAWLPLAGSMTDWGAVSYRVDFVAGSGEGGPLPSRLGPRLFERLVSAPVRRWLSADDALMRELLGGLSGDETAGGGAIAALVNRARAESVRRNLLAGSRVRFASARGVPLIEQLMTALRALLADPTSLPLNGPDAAGWVQGDAAWLVADRLVESVCARLGRGVDGGKPVPEDDLGLVDTWKAYGALVTHPGTGEARWEVRVAGEGYRLESTVLRFPLRLLYPNPSVYPAPLVGRVEIDERDAVDARHVGGCEAEDTDTSAIPQPADPAAPTTDDEPSHGEPPASAPGSIPDAEEPGLPVPETVEYLEDVEATRLPKPSRSRGRLAVHPDGFGTGRGGGRLPDAAPGRRARADAAGADAATGFMTWLRDRLGDGSLGANQPDALVHFVAEGMLLVAPGIFEAFERESGRERRGAGDPVGASVADRARRLQREFLRAGWQVRTENGIDIITYRLMRGSRPAKTISGVVVRRPERFGIEVLPANPAVVRSRAAEREL